MLLLNYYLACLLYILYIFIPGMLVILVIN